jgi:DNA-binding NarL/FixJ family response regulator
VFEERSVTTRVLLVDGHQQYRQTLRAWLAQESSLQVVGEAADGQTALRLVQDLAPKVVIIDVELPQLSGLEATRQIVTTHPGVKVLALSLYADRQFVAGMFDAGATGYVLKGSAVSELVRAIHVVTAGGTYMSPAVRGYAGRLGGAS